MSLRPTKLDIVVEKTWFDETEMWFIVEQGYIFNTIEFAEQFQSQLAVAIDDAKRRREDRIAYEQRRAEDVAAALQRRGG